MELNKTAILCFFFFYIAFVQSEDFNQKSNLTQSKDTTSLPDPCTPNPCKNTGTCTPDKGKPKCSCKKDYHGDLCEEYCQCTNGICERNEKGKLVCTCPSEWGPYTRLSCKKCDCGKGANCTFDAGFFKDTKYCICKEGYNDIKGFCTGDCSSQPCKNGGECKIVGKDIACNCVDPYIGDYCEKKKNSPCSTNPCKNGGTCDDSNGKVVCKCVGTFVGTFCEADACTPNPCFNDGKCTIVKGKVNCTCAEGFSGKNCEEDACTKNPCLNNGKCSIVNGKAKCTCAEGFSGKNCEKDACTKNPCLNNGKCSIVNGKANCTCAEGFSGKNCEKECKCENGKCVDEQGSMICVCKPEYGFYESGVCKACDCGKGANCTFDVGFFVDSKTCICPKGFVEYKGKCVDPNDHDPCHSSPCNNGGTCTKKGLDPVCACLPKYDGKWCEIDRCSPNPCENNGVCDFLDGKMKCSCQDPFTGEKCEKKCNCENGKCVEERDKVLCVCNPEFGLYKGVCEACNCGKGVNCTFSSIGKKKTCVCPKGFEERQGKCEDICKPNPCANNGTCSAVNEKASCKCQKPYFGEFCKKDPCSNKPCKYGGTCQIDGESFKCFCKDSYYGKLCNISCKCENGKCVEENGAWICFCNPEFGLYRDAVCRACKCGKGANCTFDKTLRKTKSCVCPIGFEDRGGTCQELATSTTVTTTPTTTVKTDETTPKTQSTATSPATSPTTVNTDKTTVKFPSTTTEIPDNTTTENITSSTSENTTFIDTNSSSSTVTPNETDSTNGTVFTEIVTDSTTFVNETSTPTGSMSTAIVTETKIVSESTEPVTVTTPHDLLTTTEPVVPQSTASNTTRIFLSTTTESGWKKCKKNPCKNGGTCIQTKTEQICQCLYPYSGKLCTESYWCLEGPGKDMCQADNCDFDFKTRVGRCKCSKNEYYDYEKRVCRKVDLCPLTSDKCKGPNEICKENECHCKENFKRNDKQKCAPNFCESHKNKCEENAVCQEIETDPGNIKCICKDGFVFNGKTCVQINKCDVPSILGCQQICNSETETCECQTNFTLQPDNKTCKLNDSSISCKTNCGAGTCVKTEEGEVCVCPHTHLYDGKTCIDLCTAKKVPPGLCPNDACLPDASLGFRCKCEGLLTYEKNNVTCRRKLMCSEGNGTGTCSAAIAKCVDDFSNVKGFTCICSDGREMDTDGFCKRKCDINKYKDNCYAKQAVCEMVGFNDICKCPPLQTLNKYGVCTELASASYVGAMPFAKTEYTKNVLYDVSAHDIVVPDYEKMRQDLRDSMNTLYGKTYKFADILNCSETKSSLKCVVEIQFDSDPKDQIKLIGESETCISAKMDMCFIPPKLKLWKKDLSTDLLSKTDPCMNEIKQSNCGGTETVCNKAKDDSINYMCTCAEGFTSYATFHPVSDTRTVIHRCKDIDECLIAKACPNRTRCLNTYGSYECFCQKGYKPVSASANPKKSGCVELCNPNPCGKGKCEIYGTQFTCTCKKGYTGSKCDEKISVKEESPGAKVALIALSTLVVPLVLFSLFMIYRYRILFKKVSRSSYFDDNSSILNLQPMSNRP